MKLKFFLILAGVLCFSQMMFGQNPTGYTVGPGDRVTVKVLGEPQFDFDQTVDDAGQISLPFVKEPMTASCRTEAELRSDVSKKLAVYLRDPQVNLQVTDRKSRPPASIYGEVKIPAPVILNRKTTLRELVAFSGGLTDKASGMIQVTSTRPDVCTEEGRAAAKNIIEGSIIPIRSYSLTGVEKGAIDANPQIFPGDIIVVGKAPPVYVIGQVMSLKEITIPENGLSLLEAVAQAGGFAPQAKSKDIKIRRLKSNSRERDIIAVNYDLIKKGQEKDVMLQPEDIVEVDKAPKSVPQILLELATGTARSATNFLPQRIMF